MWSQGNKKLNRQNYKSHVAKFCISIRELELQTTLLLIILTRALKRSCLGNRLFINLTNLITR